MADAANNISILRPERPKGRLPRKEGKIIQFPVSDRHTVTQSPELLLALAIYGALDVETQMIVCNKIAPLVSASCPEAISLFTIFGSKLGASHGGMPMFVRGEVI